MAKPQKLSPALDDHISQWELQMMNRCSNTTIPKMRMLGRQSLSADCPVEMSLYPLVPLVFSVDITPPPITSHKLSFDLHNIYTVFTLKNVWMFHARVLPLFTRGVAGFWCCIVGCSDKCGFSRCDFFGLTMTLECAMLRHFSCYCHNDVCELVNQHNALNIEF